MTSKTPLFDAWVARRWGKKAPERLCEVCRAALATDMAAFMAALKRDGIHIDSVDCWCRPEVTNYSTRHKGKP